MNNRALPGADLSFSELPTDTGQRHEELVDLFGRYVMWIRNRAIDSARDLVESEDSRERLGRLYRRPYEEIAAMSGEDRERAVRLAETTVDAFVELFLRVLAHRGMDFPYGPSHRVQYELNMEICDPVSGDVVWRDAINRHGAKHFADYWGRWRNRHKDEGRNAAAPRPNQGTP